MDHYFKKGKIPDLITVHENGTGHVFTGPRLECGDDLTLDRDAFFVYLRRITASLEAERTHEIKRHRELIKRYKDTQARLKEARYVITSLEQEADEYHHQSMSSLETSIELEEALRTLSDSQSFVAHVGDTLPLPPCPLS